MRRHEIDELDGSYIEIPPLTFLRRCCVCYAHNYIMTGLRSAYGVVNFLIFMTFYCPDAADKIIDTCVKICSTSFDRDIKNPQNDTWSDRIFVE